MLQGLMFHLDITCIDGGLASDQLLGSLNMPNGSPFLSISNMNLAIHTTLFVQSMYDTKISPSIAVNKVQDTGGCWIVQGTVVRAALPF